MKVLSTFLLSICILSISFAQEGQVKSGKITEAEVPSVVLSSHKSYYPNDPVNRWVRNIWNTRDGRVYTQYVAWYTHNKKQLAKAHYNEDGTGQYAAIYYGAPGTPTIIKNAASQKYPNYKLGGTEFYRILASSKEGYKVNMRQGMQKVELWLDAQGNELAPEYIGDALKDLWSARDTSPGTASPSGQTREKGETQLKSGKIEEAQVPAAVLASHQSYYPNEPVNRWQRNVWTNKEGKTNVQYVAWYTHNKKQMAKAHYNEDGRGQYGAIYYGASGVPAPVKNAASQKYPNFKLGVTEFYRVLSTGKEGYKVNLRKGTQKAEIWLDAQGNELTPDYIGEALKDLWNIKGKK